MLPRRFLSINDLHEVNIPGRTAEDEFRAMQ